MYFKSLYAMEMCVASSHDPMISISIFLGTKLKYVAVYERFRIIAPFPQTDAWPF